MTATRFPCGFGCRYLDRAPERLVVDGFRCWMIGCETGRVAAWESAAELYADELGPSDGSRALNDLARWVDAIRAGMDRGANLLPPQCMRLCRDECLAAAMIAACQAHDGDSLLASVDRLVPPEGRAGTIRAAVPFAEALAASGHILMPVPEHVVRQIDEQAACPRFH